MLSPQELRILRRCIELARQARDAGDDPFGSVLADAGMNVLAEERNRIVSASDVTSHPELKLAVWAAANLAPQERREATIYTSAEHCPMCATAQIWAGVGRMVFVLAGEQVRRLLAEGAPFIELSAREVVARSNVAIEVVGPVFELEDEATSLFA